MERLALLSDNWDDDDDVMKGTVICGEYIALKNSKTINLGIYP